MGKRLPNPRLTNIHRNYTIEEAAMQTRGNLLGRCLASNKPAADLIEYRAITETLGNLFAIRPHCASIINRRISSAKLKTFNY